MVINHVGEPENKDLPFFAYGVHKPGQIAFHQIKSSLAEVPCRKLADYEMKYRDGVPVLVGEKSDENRTVGYLMKFNDQDRAYDLIGKSKTVELFKWSVIDVDGIEANALVGVDIPNGCIDDESSLSNYRYKRDSLFTDALSLVGKCVKEYKGKKKINMCDFFILQMHHMLLWSIIERFCIFKYGYFAIGSNKNKLAKEPVFKEELKKIGRGDIIWTSDTLEDRKLNPNNYWDSIQYYYTIRCNVVHKGKTVGDEERLKLKWTLEELYEMFQAVYDDTSLKTDEEYRLYGIF